MDYFGKNTKSFNGGHLVSSNLRNEKLKNKQTNNPEIKTLSIFKANKMLNTHVPHRIPRFTRSKAIF